jgi:hypothetical protein
MGYNLHITRAKEHWQEEKPITLDEWETLVVLRDDLRRDESREPSRGTTFYIWSGLSEHQEPWLCWMDGRIDTKNPDRPIVEMMLQTAEQLNANVLGDDGEQYRWEELDQHFSPEQWERPHAFAAEQWFNPRANKSFLKRLLRLLGA